MLNKMITKSGSEILPAYMSDESKIKLREYIDTNKITIYCACKKNVPDDEKLYYRLSKDLHFIPLHKGYEHDTMCSRF